MPTCSNGHLSGDPDFCSVCGVELVVSQTEIADPCSVCGAARQPTTIRGDFCEMCGHNFRTGAGGIPPANAPVGNIVETRWELVAEVNSPANADAPRDTPSRLFPLDESEVLIGRRSVQRNIFPEISLDGDDGISHRHARLIRQADGSFAALDLGSSNGLRVNGHDLAANVLSAPLNDGDQLELGRWTRLTIRVRS